MKKHCIIGYLKCAQWRFWWDCADGQVDLNLRWRTCSNMHFLTFRFICWHVRLSTLLYTRYRSWAGAQHFLHDYMCAQRRLRSACIHRAVCSESSPTWRRFVLLATHWVPCEDSDQTARMRRLIWVFAGHKCSLVGKCVPCIIHLKVDIWDICSINLHFVIARFYIHMKCSCS